MKSTLCLAHIFILQLSDDNIQATNEAKVKRGNTSKSLRKRFSVSAA